MGLIDTFTPAFCIDVYTPLIESLKKALPQYVFITNEISHDEVPKPEVLTNNDFVIISRAAHACVAKQACSRLRRCGGHSKAT